MSAVPRTEGASSPFGSYDLQRVASVDLVSTTYRASTRRDGRTDQVALRVVNDAVASNARATKGFLHVNQRIAEVDHPHLLRVVDHGTANGVAYTATAWRDGLWLAELLDEQGPLEPGEVLRLGGQVAEALDTAHARGIVHGTVGVDSIWIRRRVGSRVPPSAALTGFGTSHLLVPIIADIEEEDAASELLAVAPEQLRGQPAEPASDQYALACVLYTALTGTAPFTGSSNNDLFGAHLFAEAPSACAVRDDLDDRWDDVFVRVFDKEPAQRYDTCRELVAAAGRRPSGRRVATARAHLAAAPSPPQSTSDPSDGVETSGYTPPRRPDADERPVRRWPPLRIALTVALLVVLAIAALRVGAAAGVG